MNEQLWRGSTHSDRSDERRSRFIDSGYELLGTGGTAAVTVRAVCRHAHLSAKYFYETFDGRDDLVLAIYESVVSDLTATALALTPMGSNRQFLYEIFLATAEFFRVDPRRARIVFTEPLSSQVMQQRARTMVPAFVHAISHHVRIDISSPSTTHTDLILGALAGSLLATYLTWLEGGSRATTAELADFCVDLVLSTPGIRAAAPD